MVEFDADKFMSTDNPLIASLPEFEESDFLEKLPHNPLVSVDVSKLSNTKKRELLSFDLMPYEPTRKAIAIASDLQATLIGGLRLRNPLLENTRKSLNVFSATVVKIEEARKEGKQQEWVAPFQQASAALVIKGITGVGKTVLLKRFFSLYPQLVNHSENKACDWESRTQIVYLIVPMSHDGSRNGFLDRILVEIDKLLCTNYFHEYIKKYKTIDVRLPAIIALLHQYYIGMLVIEELQERNVVLGKEPKLMQQLLLHLTSAGFPVVFVGNPMAFTGLSLFSQDGRRTNQRRPFTIHPVGAIDGEASEELDWKAISSAILGIYVLNEPLKDKSSLADKLLELSGGIPGLAEPIWTNTQLLALDRGLQMVDEELLEEYVSSESFAELRPIAKGFHLRDSAMIKNYQDAGYELYDALWKTYGETKNSRDSNQSRISENNNKTQSQAAVVKKQQQRAKTENTRARNKEQQREKVLAELQDDDIRKTGVKNELLTSLADLQDELD